MIGPRLTQAPVDPIQFFDSGNNTNPGFYFQNVCDFIRYNLTAQGNGTAVQQLNDAIVEKNFQLGVDHIQRLMRHLWLANAPRG